MLRSFALALLLAAVGSSPSAKGQAIRPDDNLVTNGIPPIPAAVAESVGRYAHFRSATFGSWHPTRREMLILTRFGDTSQTHLVRFPGGARTQLTFFPDNVGAGKFQPTSGDYFVFSKDRGGDENSQYFRYDLANGSVTLLTDGESRNQIAVWSNAGDRLAYSSTRRNGKDMDFHVVNPLEPQGSRILSANQGGGYWIVLDWSHDDRSLLAMEEISANQSFLWLIDTTTGAKTALTPHAKEDLIYYSGGQFTGDGMGVYVATDKDSEFQRLAYIDRATKQTTFLTSHIPWDVEEFRLSGDGKMLAFTTNEAGISVFRLLDTNSGKEVAAPKLPLGIISHIRWRKDSREIGFNMSDAHSDTDVYSLDITSGRLERWTSSETGGIDTTKFPSAELIRWNSFDGREMSGFLYTPPKNFTGKRPVVIDIHGGPESQARPAFGARNGYFANELGVATLYPNIRGSSGYGKSFLLLDNGFRREDAYKDVGALLDWIATRPDLDPDRVMVMGGSYGGHMALAVSTYYSDRIRCSIDGSGASNFVTFLENTAAFRRDLRRVEYGDERDPEMRTFLTRIAPLTNVGRIRKPLLVVQGANDPRVPQSEAEQIVKALQERGTPVWYLLAKDEGHGFRKKKNADFAFYVTVNFMQTFLLPHKP